MIEAKALEPGCGGTHSPDHMLVVGCLNCLNQCELLLNTLCHDAYVEVVHGNSSAGAHMRHILDRFHSFFAGLSQGCIDYDARQRDPEIETDISASRFRLSLVNRRIKALDLAELRDQGIQVREAVHSDGPGIVISSTVGRELMGLISHSTHHLAIIALIIKPLGFDLGCDFGKAPSTIQYQRK